MATTTVKTPQTNTAETLAIQQQAYDLSNDWLKRTVTAGQDTAAKQASTKGYYDAAADQRKAGYQTSMSDTSYQQQLSLMQAQNAAEQQKYASQAAIDQRYDIADKSFDYNAGRANDLAAQQRQTETANSQYAMQTVDKGLDSYYQSLASNQNEAHAANQRNFTASESQKDRQAQASESAQQRELQAYLGNIDAQSRITSSLFNSNSQPYDYRYW